MTEQDAALAQVAALAEVGDFAGLARLVPTLPPGPLAEVCRWAVRLDDEHTRGDQPPHKGVASSLVNMSLALRREEVMFRHFRLFEIEQARAAAKRVLLVRPAGEWSVPDAVTLFAGGMAQVMLGEPQEAQAIVRHLLTDFPGAHFPTVRGMAAALAIQARMVIGTPDMPDYPLRRAVEELGGLIQSRDPVTRERWLLQIPRMVPHAVAFCLAAGMDAPDVRTLLYERVVFIREDGGWLAGRQICSAELVRTTFEYQEAIRTGQPSKLTPRQRQLIFKHRLKMERMGPPPIVLELLFPALLEEIGLRTNGHTPPG